MRPRVACLVDSGARTGLQGSVTNIAANIRAEATTGNEMLLVTNGVSSLSHEGLLSYHITDGNFQKIALTKQLIATDLLLMGDGVTLLIAVPLAHTIVSVSIATLTASGISSPQAPQAYAGATNTPGTSGGLLCYPTKMIGNHAADAGSSTFYVTDGLGCSTIMSFDAAQQAASSLATTRRRRESQRTVA